MIAVGNDWTIWNTRHGFFVGVYSINNMVDDMEKIAKELTSLNKTMAEILYLIQKEMKQSDKLRRKYDLEREKERNES